MRLILCPYYEQLIEWTSVYICDKINGNADKKFVLGLPTGSSPLGVYKKLIELNKQKRVSFNNVITFNMDEYAGLSADNEQSYHHFMWHNFFSHIDIKKENVNILNGIAPDAEAECESYEAKIKASGGINLFLGGVGEDGHIAFNEPASSLSSRTRVKTLSQSTLRANARFFGGDPSKVPKTALTVGIGTIMDAREVLIMAAGENKAEAVRQGIEGGVSHLCALSALQMHRKAIVICDTAAAKKLSAATRECFESPRLL
jgi:glucosamine-6-phosphate deaminase